MCSLVKSVDDSKLWTLLSRCGQSNPIVGAVLEILFPSTNSALGRSHYDNSWVSTWRRERRVACRDVLDAYLHASIGDDVPTSVIESLFGSSSATTML